MTGMAKQVPGEEPGIEGEKIGARHPKPVIGQKIPREVREKIPEPKEK